MKETKFQQSFWHSRQFSTIEIGKNFTSVSNGSPTSVLYSWYCLNFCASSAVSWLSGFEKKACEALITVGWYTGLGGMEVELLLTKFSFGIFLIGGGMFMGDNEVAK